MTATKKPARYAVKVGEIFRREKGLAKIGSDLAASRKIRLANLSNELLNELLPHVSMESVHGKHLEICFHDAIQSKAYQGHAQIAEVAKSQWYVNFLGERLNLAEIATPKVLYHILWSKTDGIRRVQEICDQSYREFLYRKNFMMRLEDEQDYASVLDREEGIETIRELARSASVFRACVIPPSLLRQLIKGAMSTDYRIITSRKDPLAKLLRKDQEVRVASSAKIYHVYGDEETNVGSLRLNHELFFIYWRDTKIFTVMKFENLIFANYLSRVFDNAWKYSISI